VDFEGWTDRSKRRAPRLVYTTGAGAVVEQKAKVGAKEQPSEADPTSMMPGAMTLFEDSDSSQST